MKCKLCVKCTINRHRNNHYKSQRSTFTIRMIRYLSAFVTIQFSSNVPQLLCRIQTTDGRHDTHFHIVARVSEAGEGAEGREHGLCNCHQAPWIDNRFADSSKVDLFFCFFSSFFVLLLFLFTWPPYPQLTESQTAARRAPSSQLQSSQKRPPLFSIHALISLPPVACLSLSAVSLTSNLSFSCCFWPLKEVERKSATFSAGYSHLCPNDCSFTITKKTLPSHLHLSVLLSCGIQSKKSTLGKKKEKRTSANVWFHTNKC